VPSELHARFALDPSVVFLNHGSFGACPREVLAAQTEMRARLEAEPVRFFMRELPGLLEEARAEAASFVGARPEDFVFVRNASSGVNAVVASTPLAPGDELLTTSHAYAACRYTLDFHAARTGARVVVADVPFPIAGPDAVVDAVLGAVSARTRLALVDHVTSPTGLVFPIERIARALEERGVPVVVDGAHAPGMVPLDVGAIGASYYTGNFHKWVCAPKGAGMLHVRADRHEGLHPTVISHGYGFRGDKPALHAEFDWCGTDDPTSWLCVPAALRALASMVPGGFAELRERNHALALEARRILCEALGVGRPAPDAMIGALVALPLAGAADGMAGHFEIDPLQSALFERHSIEVPVFHFPEPGRRCIRVSAQLYNDIADYERLAAALRDLS
jgi:isopenicillin-N epimerase